MRLSVGKQKGGTRLIEVSSSVCVCVEADRSHDNSVSVSSMIRGAHNYIYIN